MIAEAWDTETKIAPSKQGMFKGKTVAALRKQLRALKKTGPHKKGSGEYTKMRELQFAIRAKTDWGKVSEGKKDKMILPSYGSYNVVNGKPRYSPVERFRKFLFLELPKIFNILSKGTPLLLVAIAAVIGGYIGHTGGDLSHVVDDVRSLLTMMMHGNTAKPMDESEGEIAVEPAVSHAVDQGLTAPTDRVLDMIKQMKPQELVAFHKIVTIIHVAAEKSGLTPDDKAQALLHAAEVDTTSTNLEEMFSGLYAYGDTPIDYLPGDPSTEVIDAWRVVIGYFATLAGGTAIVQQIINFFTKKK